MDIVRAIRNLRAEKDVKPGLKLSATIAAGDQSAMLAAQSASIAGLARLDPEHLAITDSLPDKPEGHVALVVGPVEIYLPLAELVDPAEERLRLEKDLAEAQSQIQRLEGLLGSDFAKKAPEAVVEKERERLAAFQKTAARIQSQLETFA